MIKKKNKQEYLVIVLVAIVIYIFSIMLFRFYAPILLEDCDIKGNISYASDEAIYHTEEQVHYDATKIDEDRGEELFCSEEEAQESGWRKSKL